jgi:hypothetical protein
MTFHVAEIRRRGRKMQPEQGFQAALVKLLPSILPRGCMFFAVPNGGFRTKAEAGILHGQGVRAGIPDLMFIYEGRAIGLELKSDRGHLSDNQRAMHIELGMAGARVDVARNIGEALERLREMGIPVRLASFGNGRQDRPIYGGPRMGGQQ